MPAAEEDETDGLPEGGAGSLLAVAVDTARSPSPRGFGPTGPTQPTTLAHQAPPSSPAAAMAQRVRRMVEEKLAAPPPSSATPGPRGLSRLPVAMAARREQETAARPVF